MRQLEPGDRVRLFHLNPYKRSPGSHIGLVALGVGITEALPIAAAELAKPAASSVVLLWATQRGDEIFWQDRRRALRRRHGERFAVVHIHSRDERDGALHGRVTT